MRFHQSRLVHDFIYQGVLSVLQQQTETTLPLEEIAPAPRHVPENRIAAGRNHFAVPAEPTAAREPATPRYSGGASGGNGGRQTAGGWPHAQPGYQKQQGEVYRALLQTPTTSPVPEPVAPALDGHSQSFGRVLTIVGGDCALLEHAGTIQLLSLRLRSVGCVRRSLHRVKARFARSRC